MDNSAEKTEKSPLAVAAIDGATIKALRETKKLTQLYVASVVGVTTDTISRWENNRYPTIKRDNAEKLASALEVELAEILRREDEAEAIEEVLLPTARSGRRHTLVLVLAVAVLVAVAAAVIFRLLPAAPMAERKLPRFGAPGAIIPVQLRINRRDVTGNGLIVKERLPAGWSLVNAVPRAATGQVGAEEVKWLIPSGSGPATISYTVRIPPATVLQTTARFTGEIVVHDEGLARKGVCGGDSALTVAGIHWADRNGDGRIDDDEIMPAYYLTEEMKGLGLDWKAIESIWSGRGYRWEPRGEEFQILQ